MKTADTTAHIGGMRAAQWGAMLALSISVILATSPLPPPPMVEADPPRADAKGRTARLLDPESRAALAELDRREAALQPTDAQKTYKTLGIISLSLALVPVAGLAVGFVVGMVVGAATWGIAGAFAGMFMGVLGAVLIIPWPLWLVAAGFGVASGILFNAAKTEGEGNARQLQIIRAQRREILHPTPLATVATF